MRRSTSWRRVCPSETSLSANTTSPEGEEDASPRFAGALVARDIVAFSRSALRFVVRRLSLVKARALWLSSPSDAAFSLEKSVVSRRNG